MQNDVKLELQELKVFKMFSWISREHERMRMQALSPAITERLTSQRTTMSKNGSALDDIDESLPFACLANVALPSSSPGSSSSACVAIAERTKSDQKDYKKAAMRASPHKFFQKAPLEDSLMMFGHCRTHWCQRRWGMRPAFL